MKESTEKQQFIAAIEQHPGMDAAFITVPFSVSEVFGTKGQVKVKATFDGYEYKGSLAPMGGGCHVLGIRKDIRKAIHKTFGDYVDVTLERDTQPRIVKVPTDLEILLIQNPAAKKAFEKMAYSHQREHVQYIGEAKKPETRERRILKTIENLLK